MLRGNTPYLFFLVIILIASGLKSQETYPKDYFRSPLDIPVYLSGTFGELRSNHFHTGIDLKTQGAQGKKVYAVAEGYVSRIKVSPYGYGKAIYITHPNSYVSVYGHLKKFNGEIEDYVRELQYSSESYAFDKSLAKGEINVKKGDVIGFSGNTGSSGGPHVHFEIREEKTQYPINPFLCGFEVVDNIPPEITALKLYAMDDFATVNDECNDKGFKLKKTAGNYHLLDNEIIKVSGNISFGIQVFDKLNGANNRNGAYSIELFVDSVCVWSYKMNKLSFFQGRYINTFMDYPAYVKFNARIQRSWIAPHNYLMIYDNVINNGVFRFLDDDYHKIQYVVSDYKGNISELNFMVKSEKPLGNHDNGLHKITDKKYVLFYEKDNEFINDDVIVNVPAKSLYEDINYDYEVVERCEGCFSRVHKIHNVYTPLHKSIELAIRIDTIMDTHLHEKALLVRIDEKGRKTSAGGTWDNGFIKTTTRNFGDYAVALDTIPPSIKPVNIYPGKNVGGQDNIKIRIDDDLSGIKSFRGTLNGKWILMEFNVNDNRLVYNFNDRIMDGKNTFKLTVTDNKNNVAEYSAILFR